MRKSFRRSLVITLAAVGIAAQAQSTIVLSPERASHAATLLNNGKVLITGGVNEGSVLNSALLYDPAAGTIVPTGSMTAARENHTSTLLTNGLVLIAGGDQGNGAPVLKTAEIYD